MRTRSIVAAFSTFLQFDGDRFQQWIADRRLQRSMEQRLSQGVTTGKLLGAILASSLAAV
jgi:hypothetical protein